MARVIKNSRGETPVNAATFSSLQTIEIEQVNDNYSRKSLIGEQCMLSWANMKAGMHALQHSHFQEQFFWILSGEMEFVVEGRKTRCGKDDLILVPSNVAHEVICIEDTQFVTVLSPPRTDLMPGATIPDHLVIDPNGAGDAN
jgi:quercetin dioxygenase-like cupin family protein